MSGALKALAVSAFALFAASAEAATVVIHAGHLIAEPGKPVRERQSIVIENGKITAVKDGYVAGDKVIDLTDAWVMPGLIDMHTHLTTTMDIDGPDPISDIQLAPLGRPAARVLASITRAQAILRNGFTTVRNLGDPASVTYDLRDAINAGIVDGPRIIGVEPQFTVTGGDYDAFSFGERQDLEGLYKNRGTCNGALDCMRVVREEVHRGADVIKFRLAGQTLRDPKSGPMETQEEIEAIVNTAHRLHRKVAAHSAGSAEANQMAIDAGVDSIEHGPLSNANIAAMAKRGEAYTPTLLAAKLAQKVLGGTATYYDDVVVSVGKANRAGVMIIYGTDLPVAPISREAEEFLEMKAAGLGAVDALKSATVNAASVLGLSDTVGSIAPGKAADIIAVAHDPLADLGEMGKVAFVMKGGKVFKDHADPTPTKK